MNCIKKLFQKNSDPDPNKIDKSLYHEFNSIEEADSWGLQNWKDWSDNYKSIFRKAAYYDNYDIPKISDPVSLYLGYQAKRMNGFLRSEDPESVPEETKFQIKQLICAILSAPITDRNLILYRQVPEEIIKEIISTNTTNAGYPYCEKGFLSTSLTKESCINFCGNSKHILKIFTPAGIPAIYSNSICRRNEEELLLPPYMFLRIISTPYKEATSGCIIYDTQLLKMTLWEGSTTGCGTCKDSNKSSV